jgi:hypothetical protein
VRGDHPGVVHVNGTGFGVADLDMYIYRRNADGTHGAFEAGDGEVAGSDENVSIGRRAARTTSS